MEGPFLRDVFFVKLEGWRQFFLFGKKMCQTLSDLLCATTCFAGPFILEASRVQRGIFHWKKSTHQKPISGRQEPLQDGGTQGANDRKTTTTGGSKGEVREGWDFVYLK